MDRIEVGRAAPIGPVAFLLNEIPLGSQLVQGTLHRGAGELQVGGDGAYPKPAFALGVRAVLEVHIDGHGPVGDIRVGVDGSKKAHGLPHDFTRDRETGLPADPVSYRLWGELETPRLHYPRE